jgi:hypothetical protein
LKSADVNARACGVTAGNFIIVIVLAVERYWLNSGQVGKAGSLNGRLTRLHGCSFDGNVAGIAANLHAFTTPFTVTYNLLSLCSLSH